MNFSVKLKKGFLSYYFLLSIFCLQFSVLSFSQPVNDNCANASVVIIPNGGYGLGTFSSTIYSISSATVQPGETFAPAILVAGQTDKSIWYKFTLPTTRAVRVTLAQSGTTITAGDVGFAVYKTNTCLPAVASISTKLTPLGTFGNTYHPCVDPGDYLVQVSAKAIANGSVYIQVQTDTTVAAYDRPTQAYDFGTLAQGVKRIDYSIDCQSTDDTTEICTVLNNYQQYNKSTWHVFKTPAYFDVLGLLFASPTGSFPNGMNTIGYKLYQGDARITPVSSLIVVTGCDSLKSSGYYPGYKTYKCTDLQTNTTYSIQLFFQQSFNDDIRLALNIVGTAPTQAPEPILSAIPPSNTLGILPSSPAGVTTTATDYLACNSRHSLHPCMPSLPSGGVTYNGKNYHLSTFFTFTLSTTSNLNISGSPQFCSSSFQLLFRVYKQAVSNTCSTLDTANIISQFLGSNNNLNCLDPGDYTLQVLGRDTAIPANLYFYGNLANSTIPLCLLTNLGNKFILSINVQKINAINRYSLNVPGAFDTLNAVGGIMQPLVNAVNYSSIDTFACANTVLPIDTVCLPTNTKAMYREFVIADSGVVQLYNAYPPPNNTYTKLYWGDANALANAQNVHSYPLRISGLTPFTECLQYNYACPGARVCVVPGTYTYVAFGADGNVGQVNQADIEFNVINTTHNSPANAEDIGDILNQVPPTGGSVQSAIDYFSCKDNAVPINGYQPCTISGKTATKAIYRQFYLSTPAIVSINGTNGCDYNGGYKTLFSGKATDGIAGLTALPAPWQCFQSASVGACNTLPAGWYTVISYGIGQTYANPLQSNMPNYQSYIGLINRITISVTIPCPGPKYNRPYKAAIDTLTNQPFLIQWAPRAGHTTAYPKTDTTYTLYRENYNCTVDTPFSTHPIPTCNASLTKVTYYVFRTTQESYLSINTNNYWGVVYAGDARTDSASFATATPIQPCLQSYGHIQICRLQPGTYTLVVFATTANSCTNITPTIYIDQVGYARFDHANNAYDFGAIPPDSLYHNGKPGDVNPLNAGRAPSNDFIYCTTGARQNDPNSTNSSCFLYNPNIYNTGVDNYLFSTSNQSGSGGLPRRNLWYTFVVNKPGTVRVKVASKTIGKQSLYKFAVYKSNVDGTLPFPTVVSTGQVDSTIAQGLTLVTENPLYNCFGLVDSVNFYRDPCTSIPNRYYIIIDNPTTNVIAMHPNSQLEVSILFDSINITYPGDFCSDPLVASLNGPGTSTSSVTVDCHTIGTDYGEFNPTLTCPAGGITSNYKTSWFRIDITGTDTLDVTTWLTENTNALSSDIKYRMMDGNCTAMQERSCVQDAQTQDTYKCLPSGSYYIQVFTPVLKNGIPVTGTITLHLSAVHHVDTCAPINNCLINANFIPQFNCNISDSVTFQNYSTYGSAIQYLWDFGYGGQTSTLVAPKFSYPALATNQTYTVTLIVTNTNCNGADTAIVPITIPGRPLVNLGNDTTLCNGSSLLLNATSWSGSTYLWQNNSTNPTYIVTALGTGTYYVRVTYNGCIKTDTIRVSINPIMPVTQTKRLCGNDSVQLSSYRGYGETYLWNTGSTNSSIYVNSPGTYINTISWNGCIIRDSFFVSNVILPFANTDTTICYPLQNFILNATVPGAQSYLWQNGSTAPTFTVTAPGLYWVQINYGTCLKRDSIQVYVSPVPTTTTTNASICAGQTYTLPWGAVVSTPGVYRDTLRYTITNCDSVRRIVNLTVQTATTSTTNANICAGQTYTLPWGAVVSTPGVYRDTLRYTITNCDSLRRIVNLFVQTAVTTSINAIICSGQTYTLPWGAVVSSPGVYRDTLHYTITNCDSLIRIVNLTVQTSTTTTTNASICAGQTYTLPWGAVVSAPGVYRDTLRYTITNCDSLIRVVNLTVQTATTVTTNAAICFGQTYTLPWGLVVSATGIYRDTLHYAITNCDSLIRIVNLTVQTAITLATNANICAGQTYTLPWGMVVSTQGIYRDTLHYSTTNCDSLRRIVNLTVQTATTLTTTARICAGQTYTLPWGTVVSAPGVYMDTLYYSTGCDSLRRTITLQVTAAVTSNVNATICSDQTYTLPGGTIVNNQGIYKDTVRTSAGCDSLISIVTLNVNEKPVIMLTKSNDINCIIGASQLTVTGDNSYLWSPANTLNNPFIRNPVASPGVTTTYYVNATSINGCVARDSIKVIVFTNGVNDGFILPNAFTPNKDGKNDCFSVKSWGLVSELKFTIFNRWGETVFYTTDPSKCWDGTFRGVDQNSSAFVYQISAKTNCGYIYRKGTVLLIR